MIGTTSSGDISCNKKSSQFMELIINTHTLGIQHFYVKEVLWTDNARPVTVDMCDHILYFSKVSITS